MRSSQRTRGYIALMTTIIVGLIMLALTIATSNLSYAYRFKVLAHEQKIISLALAESCTQDALLNIAKDPNVAVWSPSMIMVGDDECSIVSINVLSSSDSSEQRFAIVTQARKQYTSSILSIEASMDIAHHIPLHIVSWQELAQPP